MHAWALLRALGFKADDRVLIVHADDIGMCQATVSAFVDLVDSDLVSSGSAMVPCPWFPQVAAFCRETPHIDMGVHLTLTSEWDTYRWGPIASHVPASRLVDKEGYFYRCPERVAQHGDAAAAYLEMQTQLQCAQDAGIDVTHLDSHMFTALHPPFLPYYVQLGLEHGLPTLLWRIDGPGLGLKAAAAQRAGQLIRQYETQGAWVVDNVALMSHQPAERVEQVKSTLAALPSGLSHFIIHPARDTHELRGIARDWRCRVADYEAFMNPDLHNYIRHSDIHVIGYRALRNAMRSLSRCGTAHMELAGHENHFSRQ